ncbi:MAG: glycosyltransferase [Myxococcota bacterium]
MEVSVVLATYNGDKYLQAQLDSIERQWLPPREVIVGDDGSTDNTLSILDSFSRKSPLEFRILSNPRNLGYAENFLAAAARATSPWIAFCDQDDVWHETKLSRIAEELKKEPDQNEIMMVVHCAKIVDGDLKPTGERYPAFKKTQRVRRNGAHGFSVLPGFAKVVRRHLISDLPWKRRPRSWHPSEDKLTHDKWTNMQANALGDSLLIPGNLAYYRRHQRTVTAQSKRVSLATRIRLSAASDRPHHMYRSVVAAECALFQHTCASEAVDTKTARSLYENAQLYGRLSDIEWQRALVRSGGLGARFSEWLQLWRCAYGSEDPFHAVPASSILRDLLAVSGGLRPKRSQQRSSASS